MNFINNLMNNPKMLKTVSIVLAVVIALTAIIGGSVNIIGGEKIDCQEEVDLYNSSAPDTSSYYKSMSEDELSKRLDRIDAQLISIISMVNIDELLYTDEVATLISRFTAELIGEEFANIKFKDVKKSFPDAYEFIKTQKEAGKTWADVGVIPFGITPGDKETFIKASAAGSEAFGDNLLSVILNAPSSYNDALVPALESTHTGPMPTFGKFVTSTGLSGSKRMELLIGKILMIIEPLKAAPLSYLCEIAPDFFKNYTAAAEFLNSKKGVEKRANLVMPTIDGLLNEVLAGAGLKVPALDIAHVTTLGTAMVDESGANGGERVRINGDREAVFSYFAGFILDTLVYENNFDFVDKLLTKDFKSEALQQGVAGEILNSDILRVFLADFVDLLSKIQGRTAPDVQAEVDAYNAESKDFSAMFKFPATESTVSAAINTIDAIIVGSLSDFSVEGMIFTDSFATTVAKLTAKMCSKEISDLVFAALKKDFPGAYAYMMEAQQAGKTWADIGVIPFGITPGDRATFVKACAAGSEHFGDALAMCLLACPTSYEEALVPIFEALHTGPMPNIKDFILYSGLDAAKRMEFVVEQVLKIMDPLMASPITYLCEFLPDFVASYNKAAAVAQRDPDIINKAGMQLLPINELLNMVVADFGITLPEYDFTALEKLGTARVAASGDIGGERFEIVGDREAVFMSISSLILEIAKQEGNLSAIANVLTGTLGVETDAAAEAMSTVDTVVDTIGGVVGNAAA